MIRTDKIGFNSYAKAGGGGGNITVTTDGVTLIGNGDSPPVTSTSAQPVYFINTPGTAEVLQGNGIYIFTEKNCTFELNTSAERDGVKVVVIVYSDADEVSLVGGITQVYYQGTNIPLTVLSSGTTYEFIWSALDTKWYCIYPKPNLMISHSLDDSELNVNYPAFYYLFGGTTYNVNLPDPTYYTGQKIILFNATGGSVTLGGSYAIFFPDESDYSTLDADTSYEIISDGTNWRSCSIFVG